jgi:hypothetical protein
LYSFRIPTSDPCPDCNDKIISELEINKEIGLEEEEYVEDEYEEEFHNEGKEEAFISVEIEQVNLGTEGEPQMVKIAVMPEEEKKKWVRFLTEYKSVFVWSYC